MYTNSTERTLNNKEAKKLPEEVEIYFPGFLAFIDFTEQQIFRPVDKRKKKKKKKAYYSVKKKRHAVNNQIMVTSFIKQITKKKET